MPDSQGVATIDGDGSIVEMLGECKAGMGISYGVRQGFDSLAMSLAARRHTSWTSWILAFFATLRIVSSELI